MSKCASMRLPVELLKLVIWMAPGIVEYLQIEKCVTIFQLPTCTSRPILILCLQIRRANALWLIGNSIFNVLLVGVGEVVGGGWGRGFV